MILQELCAYADREKLMANPGFEEKGVDYVIEIDEEGRFLNLQATQDEKGRGLKMLIPALPKRTVGIAPGFLVDNAKYVLGIGMDPKDRANEEKKAKKDKRNGDTLSAFIDRTPCGKSKELSAIASFYKEFERNAQEILAQRAEEEWTGAEMLAFAIDGEAAHLSSEAREAFSAALDASSAGQETITCMVSGKVDTLARLHPVIKRVPNGQSMGTSLVSYNASAFESHGARQGANGPVGQTTAEKYGKALIHLLERTENRVYRNGVRLGGEAVALIWGLEKPKELKPMFSLLDPDIVDKAVNSKEKAFEIYQSAYRGTEPGPLDDSKLCILTIGGNASRIVVRDWLSQTLGKTKRNIRQYFSDLALDDDAPRPMPMFFLLSALDPPGKAKLDPGLSVKMFHSCMSGRAFPRTMLTTALRRLQTSSENIRNRTSIIKAALRRASTFSPEEVTVSLNTENKQPAYLLGRLFALLESEQRAALGQNINATIRDKFYASASTTPALVFGRLLGQSLNHGSKIAKEKGGLAHWFEQTKGEIIDKLDAEPMPKTLTIEEQGLFAIGYYHQTFHKTEKKTDEENS